MRLLAVLDVRSSTPARTKRLAPFSSARLAPRPGGPLTHFASPRGEKCGLASFAPRRAAARNTRAKGFLRRASYPAFEREGSGEK
ncbi:MAG: hypothetical protein OXL36_00075 [Bryobacterales bacterium]|nr:hypothetical protein [Bryobacterales bacterium]